MFKTFLDALNKKPLSEQIVEKSVESITLGKQMYINAKTALRIHGSQELAEGVLKEDKIINKSERSIRRKLLTHFALTDKIDIGSGFAISSIVIDIERIGDYAKNIADLALLTSGNYDAGPYEEPIKDLEDKIESMFDKTILAFENDDENQAKDVIEIYKNFISNETEAIKDSIVRQDEIISRSNAVVTALYMRSLKRVGAHLYNISTSVLNPFPRIGYKVKE